MVDNLPYSYSASAVREPAGERGNLFGSLALVLEAGTHSVSLQVSMSKSMSKSRRGLGFRGLFSILLASYLIWSGALDCSERLLSYPVMSLSSLITNILISTLKHACEHTCKHIYVFTVEI